ncbi:MAG: hypothetical protein ACI39Q_05530, partial [Wujia sp.]
QPDMSQQAGYDPYGMNQQMNTVYGYGGGNDGSGMPPQGKKHMSKGKLAGIIGGCVAAVAAIVCGIIFIPKLFKSDKEVVIDAFENTFVSGTEVSYLEDTIGLETLQDTLASKGGETQVTYTINKIAGVDGTDGISLQVDSKYDPVNKLVNGTIGMAYKENSLISLNIVGNETTTYGQIPELIDGYFAVPNDLSKLNSAPMFADAEDVSFSGLTLDYFAKAAVSDEASETGIWDIVTVEKLGKSKIDVNGESVKAKEYEIVLAEEDIENALNTVMESAVDIVAADPSALEGSGMDADTFNESMEQVKNMIPSLINGDLKVKVYVKDDKIVKIAASDKITLMYVDVTYDIYLDISDEDLSGVMSFSAMDQEVGIKFDAHDIHKNANGTLTIYAPENVIDVKFDVVDNSTDTADDKSITAGVTYNGDAVFNVKADGQFNRSDNSFGFTADIEIPDEGTMGMEISGAYKDINKGVSYTLDINKIAISMDDQELLDCSMVTSMDVSGVTATDIDASLPVYDLATITESEMENVIQENTEKIMAWASTLSEKTGAFGEMIEDAIYGESYNDDFGDDIDDIDDIGDDEDTADDGYTEEDMTLESGDLRVRILGCLDGFELSYACSYFVDYADNAQTVEYSLVTDSGLDDIFADFNLDGVEDIEVTDKVDNQTVEIDGNTVTYSAISYTFMEDYNMGMYKLAMPVADNAYLVLDVSVYDADAGYTPEQIAEALSSKYYKIVE